MDGTFVWSNGDKVFLLHNMVIANHIVKRSPTLSALHETPGSTARPPFAAGDISCWASECEVELCHLAEMKADNQSLNQFDWDTCIDDLKVRGPLPFISHYAGWTVA